MLQKKTTKDGQNPERSKILTISFSTKKKKKNRAVDRYAVIAGPRLNQLLLTRNGGIKKEICLH